MQFHVGPVVYRLAVSDRSVFDVEGNELEGCAVEGRRLLILSRIVEPERREEIALHEFTHAWSFHVPKPSDEEERCQLTALIAQQFALDLERNGGREALRSLAATRVAHLGKPAAATSKALSLRETFGRSDRMPCGACDTDTMVGSISNADPELHQPTNQCRLLRWFQCDACGAVQVWTELCTPDGSPLGEFVANPSPAILRGADAARFLADKRELAGA
jgi:hypothetical protein